MTLEIQLKYAAQEAALISGFSSFKNETDLDKAVKWVYEKYEGGDYTAGAALGSRGSYAKDILDKLKAPKYIKSSNNSSYTSQYTSGYGDPNAG
jgi:thiamine pyrophosphokinase